MFKSPWLTKTNHGGIQMEITAGTWWNANMKLHKRQWLNSWRKKKHKRMTGKIRLKTSNHIRNLPQPLPIIRFISGKLFHHNISFSKKDFDFFYEFSTEIMNTYSCTLICLFIVSKCKGCYFFILSFCHYQIRSTSGPLIKSIIFFDGIFSVVFFLFFCFPFQYCRWSCHTHLSLINVHL